MMRRLCRFSVLVLSMGPVLCLIRTLIIRLGNDLHTTFDLGKLNSGSGNLSVPMPCAALGHCQVAWRHTPIVNNGHLRETSSVCLGAGTVDLVTSGSRTCVRKP
jgi:hypothetical protein